MTLKESIDAEAGVNTHNRTGWDMDICLNDAKMRHGVWAPEDTLPVVARHFAKAHPKIALFWLKIYMAANGKRESRG